MSYADYSGNGYEYGHRHSKDRTEGMEDIIQVMNQLYDICHQINADGGASSKLNLPQIVVCGSQSSGKTSVLESISGEEFLPRGTDIQTRCPIVLQLINNAENSIWAELLHLPGQRFTDMSDVKAEIDAVNKKISDSKQVVSEKPITIKLHSPNVTNLTLVDLPGLVENPTQGDPPNLVRKINELVLNYISNENCIILAVSPATVDIADSKSISFARQVDPAGKRTLGVLTKLDLMDEGTTATDVLSGRKIKLQLGIIGVVNRSFKEVQAKKSLQDQFRKEREFLETHYPTLANTNGTQYLIQKISKLLMKSIQKNLPEMRTQIEQLLDKQNQVLEDMEEPLEEIDDKTALLLRLLTKFVEAYCAQVDGRRRNLEMTSLNASARIKKLFDQKLGEEFDRLVAANKLTDKEIDIAIHNSHALHSRHIDYDDAFQELAKREIRKLAPYVNKCAKDVGKEMRDAIDRSCESFITKQYPLLYQRIKSAATELINERAKDCHRYLDDYLNAEASIARTIHGGFRDKNGGYKRHSMMFNVPPKPNIPPRPTDRQSKPSQDTYAYVDETEDVTHLEDIGENIQFEDAATHRANVKKDVQMYFDAAKRQIMEHVARGIVYKLVYGTSNKMTEFMLLRLHNPQNAEQLLVDVNQEEMRSQRDTLEQSVARYEQANNVIDMILTKIDKV